jgi:hypothetical protein
MVSCYNSNTSLENRKTRIDPVSAGCSPFMQVTIELSRHRNWHSIISFAVFIIFFILILAPRAPAEISVTCTSGDQFYIDPGDNLFGQYVSYQITNLGPTDYYDLWIQIGDFNGGVVSLAANETGLCHFDSLRDRNCILLPSGKRHHLGHSEPYYQCV